MKTCFWGNLGSAGATPAVSGALAGNVPGRAITSPADNVADLPFGEAPNGADEGARALRILMTADTLGGVWNYSLELMRALPDCEFALATMGATINDAQRAELSQLKNTTFFSSSYALEWMDDPWSEVDEAAKWLLEIASEYQPDVVHLNGYAHAALPWAAPVLVVAHSCVLSWWRAVKGGEAPARFAQYQQRLSAGLAAADLVVAPTDAMLQTLTENYHWNGRGRVIPNARDPQLFLAASKQPRIFAAGRVWDDAKNLAVLDRIAPQIAWPIGIAGDITHPDGGKVEFQNVASLGKLSPAQLRQQLARSAIYALPARYEPFGLSALEAGLCGCALVLGDIRSLREVWDDAAIFVSPDDPEAIAAALNHLIADEAARSHYGQRARHRAEEYSPRLMADGYRLAYNDLLVGSAAPTACRKPVQASKIPLRTATRT